MCHLLVSVWFERQYFLSANTSGERAHHHTETEKEKKKTLMSLSNVLKPAVALVLSRILSQILLQIFFAYKW